MQNVQSVWPPCWALFTLFESCSVKFDRDQTFHWTNVERLNISFVFRNVKCSSVRLTSYSTFVQFARAQWVKVSAKFSLVQQNVQYVWPPCWAWPQLCWTKVQCCSVRIFSMFDQGLNFCNINGAQTFRTILQRYLYFISTVYNTVSLAQHIIDGPVRHILGDTFASRSLLRSYKAPVWVIEESMQAPGFANLIGLTWNK